MLSEICFFCVINIVLWYYYISYLFSSFVLSLYVFVIFFILFLFNIIFVLVLAFVLAYQKKTVIKQGSSLEMNIEDPVLFVPGVVLH